MTNSLITLKDIVKKYQTEAGEFTALKNINLSISGGDFVGIIGKSGSGKSTLINMITGIDRATSGRIIMNGTDVTHFKEGEMAVWRGKNIGIVFQFFQLLPTLTVIENVVLPMDFGNVYAPNERLKKARELLRLVDLEDQADKFPSQLSGGQQQRIAIARALSNDPPIICADEPTGNLDSRNAEQIFTLFQSLVDRGKTIVMVTHDRDLAKKVKRTILISDGQVIEEYLISTFSTLTSPQLAWVSSKVQIKRYQKGELIIREGEALNDFYIIMNGKVEIFLKKKEQDKILATYVRGQYFGEIELLGKPNSVASARAGENGARIGKIDRNTFYKILEQSPKMHKTLKQEASARLKSNIFARK